MTRYSRPADTRNPALDLGEREAFQLDLGDANGLCSYPRDWFGKATPGEIAERGFTAYEPPPPPPPPAPTPEDTPLTQRQLRLALFMPESFGGMGFAEDDIKAMIAALPDGETQAAAIEFAHAEQFHWGHPLVGALRETVRATKGITMKQLKAAWMAASEL